MLIKNVPFRERDFYKMLGSHKACKCNLKLHVHGLIPFFTIFWKSMNEIHPITEENILTYLITLRTGGFTLSAIIMSDGFWEPHWYLIQFLINPLKNITTHPDNILHVIILWTIKQDSI